MTGSPAPHPTPPTRRPSPVGALRHRLTRPGASGHGAVVVLLVAAVLAGLAGTGVVLGSEGGDSWAPAPKDRDGLQALAETKGDRFLLHTAGGKRDFLPGVNLGVTLPGHAPDEVALRRTDVRRWLPMMGELGLRVVRVSTILPPHFYEELRGYNLAYPDAPIYLLHGVEIPEARFMETRDLYDAEVGDGLRLQLSDAVGVVHGTTELPERHGHAHGRYTADVTPWLLGWAIGIEWDPEATYDSDLRNRDRPPFEGRYFAATEAASATESWLAEMLDHLAAELAERGLTMPLSFSNWPTTDPLEHPEEPLPVQDLVGVDANNVLPTSAWPGGTFAGYHAYPYYPDFQRFEPGIADHVHDGVMDPYAGYLTKLREHHDGMPLMITEFGVPSSPGTAHLGPLGRDQGGHDERTQQAINAELLRVIADLDLAGGLASSWTDEWSRPTWNTMDLEIPAERRPVWRNVWTSAQHFGLLAHEPGPQPRVLVGGDEATWTLDSQVIHAGRGAIEEVRVTHDEGYLYLRVVLAGARGDQSLAVDLTVLDDPLDVTPEPGRDPAASHAITVPTVGPARAWVRAAHDPHAWVYGATLGMLEVDAAALASDPGAWRPQRLMINTPYDHPITGEPLPAEEQEVGLLRPGTTDPEAGAFDSLAMWHEDEHVLTLRLPWATVGFADPSSNLALVVGPDGALQTREVERIGISIGLGTELVETAGYTWEPWQLPSWHERPKAGLEAFADAVADVTP